MREDGRRGDELAPRPKTARNTIPCCTEYRVTSPRRLFYDRSTILRYLYYVAMSSNSNPTPDPDPDPNPDPNPISNTTALSQPFLSKKKKILQQLAAPSDGYSDLSPKGSIDEGIRDLIDEINRIDGCVTTSSCAGRISVFLEGSRTASNAEQDGALDPGRIEGPPKSAGVGGKGAGGRWLFVSHDPVDIQRHSPRWSGMLGMDTERIGAIDSLPQGSSYDTRFIHFKFEPMVWLWFLMVNQTVANCVIDPPCPDSLPRTSPECACCCITSRVQRERRPQFDFLHELPYAHGWHSFHGPCLGIPDRI